MKRLVMSINGVYETWANKTRICFNVAFIDKARIEQHVTEVIASIQKLSKMFSKVVRVLSRVTDYENVGNQLLIVTAISAHISTLVEFTASR